MSMTIEQLAAEAAPRGVTAETIDEELAARLADPIEAFIGSAASGDSTSFDIHVERRAAVSVRLVDCIHSSYSIERR